MFEPDGYACRFLLSQTHSLRYSIAGRSCFSFGSAVVGFREGWLDSISAVLAEETQREQTAGSRSS